jgi:hypothetical protein
VPPPVGRGRAAAGSAVAPAIPSAAGPPQGSAGLRPPSASLTLRALRPAQASAGRGRAAGAPPHFHNPAHHRSPQLIFSKLSGKSAALPFRPGEGGKPARRGRACRPASGIATGRKLLQGARPAPPPPRTCSRRRTRRPKTFLN